jgi:hypothetical protein
MCSTRQSTKLFLEWKTKEPRHYIHIWLNLVLFLTKAWQLSVKALNLQIKVIRAFFALSELI